MARGATMFPSATAYGATWNPELIERAAAAIGVEARSVGCRQGLAPVLDVSRDVRWGRTEETFGEDPYLVGVMGTRYVRGLQGEKRDLLATLKHYAGHSFSEGARNHAPVHLGWRELNDTFLLPFEMAVKLANAGSVMPAYHDVDNESCHASRHLLTTVLREEWGFDGLIVADYIGINLLYQHHNLARDPAEAAAMAFNAGLDIELPSDDCASHLEAAVERGQISIETIDHIVSRIVTEKFRLGLFEQPYADEGAIRLQAPATVAVAGEVARQSIVVLENNGVLPLDSKGTQKIALIGPTADDPMAMLCGYSFPVHLILGDAGESASQVITPRAALERAIGADRVTYAQGCAIIEQRKYGSPVFPGDVEKSTSLDQPSPVSMRTDGIAWAADCAKAADVAIVCVGDLAGLFQTGTVGEGIGRGLARTAWRAAGIAGGGRGHGHADRRGDDERPTVQPRRPRGQGGRVRDGVQRRPGRRAGHRRRPHRRRRAGGRLPLSVPRNVGAVPYYYNHKMKSAGTPIARHFGSRYPFGYGRAYTAFDYGEFSVERPEVPVDGGTITVRFRVRNTGARAGTAVPQLYVRDPLASMVRPVKELKAFGRIDLQAGEAATVTFDVPTDMLCFTGQEGRRIVEAGEVELQVGESSADIRLRGTATLVGETRALSGKWRMESTCTGRALNRPGWRRQQTAVRRLRPVLRPRVPQRSRGSATVPRFKGLARPDDSWVGARRSALPRSPAPDHPCLRHSSRVTTAADAPPPPPGASLCTTAVGGVGAFR